MSVDAKIPANIQMALGFGVILLMATACAPLQTQPQAAVGQAQPSQPAPRVIENTPLPTPEGFNVNVRTLTEAVTVAGVTVEFGQGFFGDQPVVYLDLQTNENLTPDKVQTVFKLPMCMPMIDGYAWYFDSWVVKVDGKPISLDWSGVEFDYLVNDENGRPLERCDFFRIPVDETFISAKQIEVQFNVLRQTGAEVPDCAAAQAALNAARSSIVIACTIGEGTFGFDIVSRPETLSDEQAREVVADTFNPAIRDVWVYQGAMTLSRP